MALGEERGKISCLLSVGLMHWLVLSVMCVSIVHALNVYSAFLRIL